jgi:hypothetical protein
MLAKPERNWGQIVASRYLVFSFLWRAAAVVLLEGKHKTVLLSPALAIKEIKARQSTATCLASHRTFLHKIQKL